MLAVPSVVSIDRAEPEHTAAAEVTFTVTFSEAVTGVDASDFSTPMTGDVFRAVHGDFDALEPVVSGSGAVYTVQILNVMEEGTIGLNALDDGSIKSVATNDPLSGTFTGQTYTTDVTKPAVQSINRVGAETASGASVDFTVTFSEPVTEVDSADFAYTTTLSAAATTIAVNSVTDAVYTVTVSGITGTGDLGLNLVDNGTIVDRAGHGLTPNIDLDNTIQSASGALEVHVVTADMNNDGKLDLISTQQGVNKVAVRLGNGDGTFQSPTTYGTGLAPYNIEVDDLDDDGYLDVVTANQGNGGGVSVFLNDGAGGLTAQATLFITGESWWPAIKDYDEDGNLDVAVAVSDLILDQGRVEIWLGDGLGGFTKDNTFNVSLNTASYIEVSDVNGDMDYDLMVASLNRQVDLPGVLSVFLGNGDGTFGTATEYAVGGGPIDVDDEDLDGDGDRDAIVFNYYTHSVDILLSDGIGGFGSPTSYSVGANPRIGEVFDIDGDTFLDIVVANKDTNDMSVLMGRGDGTFDDRVHFDTGNIASSVAVGDYNADSILDFAVTNAGDSSISILLGQGDADFTGQTYTMHNATVDSRLLFYEGSSRFDTTGQTWAPLPNANDNAIATNKIAYQANGLAATFASLSSYDQGINGIMVDLDDTVDISGLTAANVLDDFTFRIGDTNTPASWTAASSPTSVNVRADEGAAGSDRIEFIWASGAPTNTWLEVTVKSTARTGLPDDDVFYFGNLIGNSGEGDSATQAITNAIDEQAARDNPANFLNPANITNLYDYNRDGYVNATDQIIARDNHDVLFWVLLEDEEE